MLKKKILIISESFYPEEFKINDIAFEWVNKGFEVDVLTLVPTYPLGKVYSGFNNFIYQKEFYRGVNIIRLKAITGYLENKLIKILKYINFMILGSFAALIIGRKYDYVFGFNMAALTDMLPAVLISKLFKKPTLFWVQDIWPDSLYAYGFKKNKFFSYLVNFLVSFIYNNISSIAISSRGYESKLRPYINKKLEFIFAPNWADELDLNVEPYVFSNKKKVQFNFSGNIGKVQNLENIIVAFSMLSYDFQEKSQLNIIGDGSNLKKLKTISKDNPNIVFFGLQERTEMSKFYLASDFLIISLIDKSIYSSTIPSKLQTYISAKKPILGIIKGEVANIIEENNLGICVDPSNINLIKEAFERCIKMSELERASYTSNNNQLLNSNFNKDLIIDKLLKILVQSVH